MAYEILDSIFDNIDMPFVLTRISAEPPWLGVDETEKTSNNIG